MVGKNSVLSDLWLLFMFVEKMKTQIECIL